MSPVAHHLTVRVYYEDTDLAGIVYYANYLKFIERARSEWLRAIGVDQVALRDAGVVFAVRRVEADYLSPARFEDLLTIHSRLEGASTARITMRQDVFRGEDLLFSARVVLVSIGPDGRPLRLPQGLAARLGDG